MQINKVLKGIIVALPVLTLMACSSNDGADEAAAAAAANEAAAAASAQAGANNTSGQGDVQVGAVEKPKSAAEIRAEKIEELSMSGESTVYFAFDRSNVDRDFYSVLDKHAEFLAANPGVSIVIEGHCDERGTPEYNIALGERRAKSVQTYLQNSGVSSSQISTVSYGEEKPVDYSRTEAGFSKNRRAVLVYQQ